MDFTIKPRQTVIVYLYHLKQCRQLKKYGVILYVSSKLKYVVLSVDATKLDQTLARFKQLRFIKRVRQSHMQTLPTNFAPTFAEYRQAAAQTVGAPAAHPATAHHGAVTPLAVAPKATTTDAVQSLATAAPLTPTAASDTAAVPHPPKVSKLRTNLDKQAKKRHRQRQALLADEKSAALLAATPHRRRKKTHRKRRRKHQPNKAK